jgi:hypothetical protein
MRYLILGTNKTINTNLAMLLADEHKDSQNPQIFVSFQASKTRWLTQFSKQSVWSAGDKEVPEKCDFFIADQVISPAFYENEWIQTQMKNCANLITVTSAPVSFLDTALWGTFDEICLTNTVSCVKQKQFYNLFIPKEVGFAAFKAQIKDLSTNQYLNIVGNELVVRTLNKVIVTPDATATKPELKIPESVDNLLSQVSDGNMKPCNDDEVSLWVSMLYVDNKENLLTEFKNMLKNPLLNNMYSKAYVNSKHNNKMTVYFSVKCKREDLFTALIVNVLRSLVSSNLISTGGLVV